MKVILTNMDLDPIDTAAARRHYRILRIAIYAPQRSIYAHDTMYQGCYGLSREEAKQFIADFYDEVSHRAYLGSK